MEKIRQKFVNIPYVIAVFAIVLFCVLASLFYYTKQDVHVSELAFSERSAFGIGSVVPASCESGAGEGGVPHFGGDNWGTCGAAISTSLSWNPSTVYRGQVSTITWNSWPTNQIANCQFYNGFDASSYALPLSGNSSAVQLTVGTFNFAFSCWGGSGQFSQVWAPLTILPNDIPVVNAGPDIILTNGGPLIIDGQGYSTTSPIGATASDSDDAVLTFRWTLVSSVFQNPGTPVTLPVYIIGGGPITAPSGSIMNPIFANLRTPGSDVTYTFRLTVTDSRGASVSDDVQVFWRGSRGPAVNAGGDRAVALPATTQTASGANAWSSVSSGATAWWQLISKPIGAPDPVINPLPAGGSVYAVGSSPVNITTAQRTISTNFENLTTVGTYKFRLRAQLVSPIDGLTYTDVDDMEVVVTAAGTPPCAGTIISSCSLPTTNPGVMVGGTCQAPNNVGGYCAYKCNTDGTWMNGAPSVNSCYGGFPEPSAGDSKVIVLPVTSTTTTNASVRPASSLSYPSYCYSSTEEMASYWDENQWAWVSAPTGNYVYPTFGTVWPSTFYAPCAPSYAVPKAWSYQWENVEKPSGAPNPIFSTGGSITNMTNTTATYHVANSVNTTISNLTVPGIYRFALKAANGHNLTPLVDSAFLRVTVYDAYCPASTISECSLAITTSDTITNGICTAPGQSCSYRCGTGGVWDPTPISNSCVPPQSPCSPTTVSNCSLPSTNVGSSAGSCAVGYSGACSYQCASGSAWNTTSGFTNNCVLVSGDLSADDETPDYGVPVTLNWTTTGVTSCTVTGNGQTWNTTTGNNQLTNPILNDTTFILTCDGVVRDSVPIDVDNGISLTVDERIVETGTDVTLTWETTVTDEALCTLTGTGINVNPMSPALAPNNQGTTVVQVNGRSTYILSCPDPANPVGPRLNTTRIVEVIGKGIET